MALREGFVKALIVIIPTYLVAYSTEKMVYVIPMLAACTFIATSMFTDTGMRRRVDEDARGEDPENNLEAGERKDDGS
jgi:hypothetical protein